MNDYEAKQQRKREHFGMMADKAQEESDRQFKRVDNLARVVDGQPILIGHHSEKRARRDQQRMHGWMRKGIDEMKVAKELRHRADAVGSGGISSDDPDAVAKLKEKLAGMEAQRLHMKAVNAAHARYLKKPESLDAVDLPDADKATIRAYKPEFPWLKHPYAPYQFQNLGGNIARVKERIETLGASVGREAGAPVVLGDLTIVQNAEENRVQLMFPGKPAEAVRKELKSRGFRWSPTSGAWQRHLNGSGIYSADEFGKWYLAQAVNINGR